jgi:Protein of unknown function (DUF3134)
LPQGCQELFHPFTPLDVSMVHNPSLREEPKDRKAGVIPPQAGTSILHWLESNGRMLSRDGQDFNYLVEEEEISGLMGEEDNSYDLEEDDNSFVEADE